MGSSSMGWATGPVGTRGTPYGGEAVGSARHGRGLSPPVVLRLLAALALIAGLLAVDVSPAGAATRVWDGGAADDNWTSPTNWLGDLPVSAGDALVFPGGVAQASVNDLAPGTGFASITFSGLIGGHDLNGNGVVVGTFAGSNSAGSNTVSLPITLPGPATSTVTEALATIVFDGSIDLAGSALTLGGGGSHLLTGSITGSGTIAQTGAGGTLLASDAAGESWTSSVSAGTLRVTGNQPGNVVTIAGGALTGNGTIGGVTSSGSTASTVAPGGVGIGRLTVAGDASLGALDTFAVHIGGMTPGTEHDQLDVNGEVALGGATLSATFGFLMPTNQEVVIVDNDGAEAVTGTFAGLPDGATFTGGPLLRTYRIEYDGGDGNDVTIARLDERWVGSGGDGLWSTGANWVDGSAPADGDSLMFESVGVGALTNDLTAGTDLTFAGFNVGGYTVTGNGVDLAGGMWASHPGDATTDWGLPTKVTTGQTWETISGARLRVSGAVTLLAPLAFSGDGLTDVVAPISSLASEGLTKNGSGTVVLAADNAVTGTTTVNGGTLTVSGDLSEGPTTVSGGVVNGSGTLGALQVDAGTLEAGNSAGTHGILTVGGLTLTPSASFAPELDGMAAGVSYDQVAVTGDLDLGSASLALDLGFSPANGAAFTIIDVQGAANPFGPPLPRLAGAATVTGTFAGLPEGAELTADGTTFTITYEGGDGDDVVVTARVPTATTTSPATTTTTITEPATTTTSGGPSATTSTSSTTSTTGTTSPPPSASPTPSTGPPTGTTTGSGSGSGLPLTGGGAPVAPLAVTLLGVGAALAATRMRPSRWLLRRVAARRDRPE